MLNFWYFIGKTLLPSLVWRQQSDEKVVYLTFDDGPHPEITPWVMEELDKVGAKGTFFMVGDNIRKHPYLVNKVSDRNHSIGNHTMHHVKGWRMSSQEYLKDVQDFRDLGSYDAQFGLFRPPYGQINLKSIQALNSDYKIVMWDVLTKDYLKTLNVSKAQRRIQRNTSSGSIIVFHDSEKAKKNLKELLPEYLQFLKREGYKMKAL